ncbi:hypothetical protein FRB99_005225 [Tulasnella sp. 403]|nr:hypothetical protein FRB99_005225 [Tulasnella sp. 403]
MSSTAPTSDAPPPYQREQSNHDLQVPMTDVARKSMEDEERSLPEGWLRQFDANTQHHFYVDTRAKPPRSIWVHPYDDEQFQKEHPELVPSIPSGSAAPPSPSGKLHKERPLPDVKTEKTESDIDGASSAGAGPSTEGAQKAPVSPSTRGFFGKLKDKAIGTKEEREAEEQRRKVEKQRRKAEEEERARQYMERRKILLEAQYRQQQMPNYSNVYNYGYRPGTYYAPPSFPYNRRPAGGSNYAPVLGGVLGGLLLADALDGGLFDGGGFDGGFF